MNVPWQILIASANLEDRRAMSNIMAKQDLDPMVASSVRKCQETMAHENVGLIFCARSLADPDYRDLLIATRGGRRRTRTVLTARISGWDEYLDAMRLGAFDVISAPCRPTDMEWMIIQALRDEHARMRQSRLRSRLPARFEKAASPNQRDGEITNAPESRVGLRASNGNGIAVSIAPS